MVLERMKNILFKDSTFPKFGTLEKLCPFY